MRKIISSIIMCLALIVFLPVVFATKISPYSDCNSINETLTNYYMNFISDAIKKDSILKSCVCRDEYGECYDAIIVLEKETISKNGIKYKYNIKSAIDKSVRYVDEKKLVEVKPPVYYLAGYYSSNNRIDENKLDEEVKILIESVESHPFFQNFLVYYDQKPDSQIYKDRSYGEISIGNVDANNYNDAVVRVYFTTGALSEEVIDENSIKYYSNIPGIYVGYKYTNYRDQGSSVTFKVENNRSKAILSGYSLLTLKKLDDLEKFDEERYNLIKIGKEDDNRLQKVFTYNVPFYYIEWPANKEDKSKIEIIPANLTYPRIYLTFKEGKLAEFVEVNQKSVSDNIKRYTLSNKTYIYIIGGGMLLLGGVGLFFVSRRRKKLNHTDTKR